MAQLADQASSDQALRVVIAVLHAERFADVTDRYLPRAELAEDRYRLLVRRFGHDQHDAGAAILAQGLLPPLRSGRSRVFTSPMMMHLVRGHASPRGSQATALPL